MSRALAAVVVLFLSSCESEAPKIAPPARVDAGAARAEASRIESNVAGELKKVEAQAANAAPALPDAGQKSGVNE